MKATKKATAQDGPTAEMQALADVLFRSRVPYDGAGRGVYIVDCNGGVGLGTWMFLEPRLRGIKGVNHVIARMPLGDSLIIWIER
jgi:hypothetical protein